MQSEFTALQAAIYDLKNLKQEFEQIHSFQSFDKNQALLFLQFWHSELYTIIK